MNDPNLCIRIPGRPVSVNAMYKPNARGGKYLTLAALAWREMMCYKSREITHKFRWAIAQGYLSIPLQVRCTFYGMRPNADADNLLKCTLDGLKLGLDIDDKHFAQVTAIKASDKRYPDGAVIEIWASEGSKT